MKHLLKYLLVLFGLLLIGLPVDQQTEVDGQVKVLLASPGCEEGQDPSNGGKGVPEPLTISLLATGAVGIGAYSVYKKRNKK